MLCWPFLGVVNAIFSSADGLHYVNVIVEPLMKLVHRKDVTKEGTTGRRFQETALRSDNVGELEGRK